eukprot:GHRR01009142.1.p1 GENE.GHRR01009142.1~~GHRR01009142.1.p1  ORF type:complete len:896 (+),score=341.24 GHRR01009142.1:1003-3690(+)
MSIAATLGSSTPSSTATDNTSSRLATSTAAPTSSSSSSSNRSQGAGEAKTVTFSGDGRQTGTGSGSGPTGSGSSLASVATGKGPLVFTSVEESAEAQQALRLLDEYDFRIYGQGFMAGATAEPLTSKEHTVMYAPVAERQEDAAPPAAVAAKASSGSGSSAATAKQSDVDRTVSGTPALRMKPLPGGADGNDSGAAAPGGSGLQQDSSRGTVCMTLDQALQQQNQDLQQQRQQAQLNHRARHAKGPAAAHDWEPATASVISNRPSQTGFKGRVQRGWQITKRRVVEGVEDALAWLLHMLWIVMLWVVRLLVAPLTAVFGPWYFYNRHKKQKSAALLAHQLDLPQLHELLGALPSWLSGIGGATEKVAWLNTLLTQVWPVLDPVVCQLIRDTVEPLLDDMKPPFISAMGFQKLTLGELPLELEGIRVIGGDKQGVSNSEDAQSGADREKTAVASAQQDDRLEVEVDFHWVGEPNISFFVELAIAGPYTRLVPKLSHLSARGTLRLGITRLVPEIPGFGAVMFSLARSPQVKFTLDFGPALGGRVTARPVAAFLDPFIRDTLANLLVWPNRIAIPLLPRNVIGSIDDLNLHSIGVLEVEVLAARNLPKKGGVFSTVDPQVEIWTQPQHHVHSSVKKSSRNPNWRGQLLEVLVQEPDSQQLRVVLNDIDMLNVKELLRVNLLKGASHLLRSANPIGRAAVSLRDICSKPFVKQEIELKLSGTEWAYEMGIVDDDDHGTLDLALTYKPFQDLDANSTAPIAARGSLSVDIRQCQDLAAEDWSSGSSDPYVLLKVAGQKQQTAVMPQTTHPTYNAHFEFFNVQLQDVLKIEVWDRDRFKFDDLIGQLELPIKTMLTWVQAGKRGWRDGWWRLKGKKDAVPPTDNKHGRIEMKVQYRPYSA